MTDSVAVFSPMLRISDANGNPVSNGTVEFYEAGTSTPKTVYADKDLSTTLGTVISTDSSGYPKTSGNARTLVFTGTSAFKMIVKDAAGITLVTHDNVPGAVAIPVTDEIALPETPVSSKTSTYSVQAADQGKVINANPTSGSFAITLLSAVTAEDGFRVTIRHAGTANVVTIRSTAGQTIGISGASVTSFSLKSLGEAVQLVSDGGNWYVDGSTPALMQDGLAFFKVTDRLTAPPSSPVGGARYIINGTPTGVWSTLSYAQHDVVESDGNGSWFRYTPAEGWLAYVEDENLYTAFIGTAWADQTGMSTPSTSTLKMGIWLDQRADGTSTGSTTTGAWTTHTLQTEAANSITGASLASNKITLPAGTYNVDADGVFSRSDAGQLRLRLETAGTIFYGINGVSGSGADGTHGSQVVATFTLASADNLILEYYLQTNSSGNALGTAMGIASNLETYAYVRVLSLTALQGPQGSQGIQGQDGLDAAFAYQWNTATSGDPGSGKILGNSATIASITQINISETDFSGGALAAVLAAWDDSTSTVKATLKISKEGAPQNFHVFKISGSGTDAGSYWTFPVTYVATSGTIGNGDNCSLIVVEKGDKGDTGSAGGAGATGATGPNLGLDYLWSTSTSGDPGTGYVLVNNATPASVTAVHISETNRNSASQAGYLATWDDSTTTSARGIIRIVDVSNPGVNYLEYMITGAMTDAGGYDTFPVSYVGHAGTMTLNGVVSVVHFRTGNAGAGSGDVVGPSSSVAGEVLLAGDTTGKLLARSGVTYYTPRRYGCVGDGATDDTTNFNTMVAAVNTAGGNAVILITEQHKITSSPTALTASNVDIIFQGKGEIIYSGSSTCIWYVGPTLTSVAATVGPLAADIARHATSMTLTNAASLNVGDIIRFDWTNDIPVITAFATRITAKSGNVITFQHPFPHAITSGETFAGANESITTGSVVSNVRVTNPKFSTSSYTGGSSAPISFRNAYQCSIRGARVTGMVGSALLAATCVDCHFDDIVSTSSGDSLGGTAVSVYAMTGCSFTNFKILNSNYFPWLLFGGHHCTVDGVHIHAAGSLTRFCRGFETWDVSRTSFNNINLTDVYGVGIFLENKTRDCTFSNIHATTLTAYNPIPATITVTIASPAVVSWASHGRSAGDKVIFTTTGALPTGMTAGTVYYVIATGLGVNSFQFSTTPGGSAVNTSGSQSGTHTGWPGYTAAQSVATNGTSNTNNVWVNVWARGTPTESSGADIVVASGDTNQIFINAAYDTIANYEPTTQVMSHISGLTTWTKAVAAPVWNASATGSVSAPVFTYSADPNTGIWFPSADNMAAAVGGVEAFRVLPHGSTGKPQVTIGTTTAVGFSTLGVENTHAFEAIAINSPTRTSGTPLNDANGYMRFYNPTDGGVFAFGGYNISSDKKVIFASANNYDITFEYGGAQLLRLNRAGNFVAGNGNTALATTATDGFLYVPTCAGTPTGVPTTYNGMSPIVVNTTNNKLYFYSGGAWRDAGP